MSPEFCPQITQINADFQNRMRTNPQVLQMSADSQKTNKDPQTYAIIGAAMEVHRELGSGFLEAVYQEALAIEFETRGIPFKREVVLPVFYKERVLKCGYRADFICNENIVVELKAIGQLTGVDDGQLINALTATRFNRGLLLNFGAKSLEYRRRIQNLCESAESADEIGIENINLTGA
jgi:GxxExxY protein